jgi:ribosomal protein S27AE
MTQRYSVSGSVGTRDGKRFVVWDKQKRQAAEWHRTFAKAQRAAQRLNRECSSCGGVLPDHREGCPLATFGDPILGGDAQELDEDDEEA